MSEKPRVWVVYSDRRKDLSAAEKFGQLTDMFYHNQLPRKVDTQTNQMILDTEKVIKMARKMLRRYSPGDFILPIGDPILCSIVETVAVMDYAPNETVQILRWDRQELEYHAETHDFSLDEEEERELDEYAKRVNLPQPHKDNS